MRNLSRNEWGWLAACIVTGIIFGFIVAGWVR
jgi:hypothetical protein